ncbi:MAG TPA: insulinase family protein [Chloroflexi bacterium]|nr:insulinase family protein [Chloroflexota bacterium]
MIETKENADGLIQTQLSNGLSVLVKETHTAPVASFWVWYRVGSRNEHTGITGVSHWVEHMLFKGTPTYPKGVVDKLIAREGGMFNGMTWYDFTTFYATLPAPRIELALRIEADRMTNAAFDVEEAAAERTVIISERQGAENSPQFLLNEEVMGAAFRVHPYGTATIGHMCDLETMTREQLYHHYRTYYTPKNSLVVAVGDFDTPDMLRMIEKHFGAITNGPDVPRMHAVEPPQRGERRIVLEGDGFVPYLQVVFRAPSVRDPDFFALTVLGAALAGASGMTFAGGSSTNKSSRLYKALVKTEITATISGSLIPTIDPFVYSLSAIVRPDHTPAEAEQILEEELARVASSPITAEEVNKAIKQAKAQFAYSSESVTAQALWAGFSEMFADYDWFEHYIENLSTVTVEDVQRVAQEYLHPSKRTVGWYIPKKA